MDEPQKSAEPSRKSMHSRTRPEAAKENPDSTVTKAERVWSKKVRFGKPNTPVPKTSLEDLANLAIPHVKNAYLPIV
jgi:hypothetical protein